MIACEHEKYCLHINTYFQHKLLYVIPRFEIHSFIFVAFTSPYQDLRNIFRPGLTVPLPVGQESVLAHIYIHILFTTKGYGGPLWASDYPAPGPPLRQHKFRQFTNIYSHNHTRIMDDKWRPNGIPALLRPKVSRLLSCGWVKIPKKPDPEKLSRPGIEPGPTAWEARTLSGDHGDRHSKFINCYFSIKLSSIKRNRILSVFPVIKYIYSWIQTLIIF